MSMVDRTQTESSLLSVGRPGGRLLYATIDRANPVHVVHTGWPGGRPAFSTGRPCSRPRAYPVLLQCAILLLCLPIPVLPPSISSISSLPTAPVSTMDMRMTNACPQLGEAYNGGHLWPVNRRSYFIFGLSHKGTTNDQQRSIKVTFLCLWFALLN